MPLINCKVELKFKQTKHKILASAGTENDDANSDHIIFTVRDTEIYVLVGALSTKDNQKLSKLFSKGLKDHCIGINIKRKMR